MNIVELIENTETGPQDRPVRPVIIADCGELVAEDTPESKEEVKTNETIETESSN